SSGWQTVDFSTATTDGFAWLGWLNRYDDGVPHFSRPLREVGLFSFRPLESSSSIRSSHSRERDRFRRKRRHGNCSSATARGLHQSAPDWIAMNISQLLNSFVLGPNIVVIKPALPNV